METDLTSEIEQVLKPFFTPVRFKAQQLLWHEGDPGSKMISIIKGKVRIYRSLPDGKQASIFLFGPGETFGFLPLIDRSPYPASAEVIEDLEALVMTREKLYEVMRQYPDVAVFLLTQLAKRLRGAFDQIEMLSTRGVLPRVAAALISLTGLSDKKVQTEIITLPVSSREYAGLLGLTPESLSRGITKLSEMGIIHRIKGNTFQVLDHNRLLRESRPENQ